MTEADLIFLSRVNMLMLAVALMLAGTGLFLSLKDRYK